MIILQKFEKGNCKWFLKTYPIAFFFFNLPCWGVSKRYITVLTCTEKKVKGLTTFDMH